VHAFIGGVGIISDETRLMQPPSDEGEPPSKRRILVLHVDDQPEFGDLVTANLERLDEQMTVCSRETGDAALETLADQPVDCVISDYQMPDMDGIELLRTVRDEHPNLPFILFTGRGSEEVASTAIEAGVTSYLRKSGGECYEQLRHRVRNAVSRQRSQRLAKVRNDRLLALYEQTDGFYVLDDEWRITYWNQEIAERTGVASETVIGEVFWDVFPKAVDTPVHEEFRTAMETETATEFEINYQGYWAETRAYPVEDGLFVHSRNISAEKTQEQELRQRNRILQSFANTVSHDLRNPLNVAEGRLELAQETGDFDHLEEVAQAHNRMRNLIDELLRLSRGEQPELAAVSIEEVASQAWETVDTETTALHIEDDAVFEAHASQLRRLFENLFWNALEHGDASAIRAGELPADGFYVGDDGSGIPQSERDVVFDSGYSTDTESPGYGLSIVEGIVEMHGASVAVAESDDGGARFEVREMEPAEATA
jgi:PAS domain S-box-containing protein